MKPYVFITRKIPEKALHTLKEVAEIKMWEKDDEAVPEEILLSEAKKADGLLTMVSDRIDEEVLKQAENLKVVANMAVGFDNIDVKAATRHNVVICNTPDVLTDTTADLTFALMMAVGRRLMEAADYIKNGKWVSWSPLLLAGTDIHHKTMGIVGMGRIGEAVARRAKGFEMKVLYHNRNRKPDVEEKLGAEYRSFEDLLSESDFVVNLTPLSNETKHLFNSRAFTLMKKSSFFINASRGAIVDEKALIEALEQGRIAGAGLDVFEKEPISFDHPLLKFHNVVALPHIGSASMETRLQMAELAANNIAAILQNKKTKAVVNDELL
ncbi:2-hydroxyacid dehydrogenase [Fictibacillus gelatini]|uniref:2-hydroxyacid dehydrogenase n=1 Tax=Fictibacillus gelatini TaxID=225985 RepID=UPI000404A49A|nr:D-glycerate dehydrogenase [Fictibacillus gelatini]